MLPPPFIAGVVYTLYQTFKYVQLTA